MSTLAVQSVKLKKEFEGQYGKSYVYTVMGMLDDSMDSVEMTVKKPENAPKQGETIEVTVEDTQWGKKAKKVQQNTFGGAKPAYKEDPERQAMIVRQNALTNAVTFLGRAVELGTKDSKDYTSDNVLLVAEKFARFSLGELKPEHKRSAVEVLTAEPEEQEFFEEEYLP